MGINRPDIAIAVTKSGRMLVAQGSGIEQMKKENPDIEDIQGGLFYSQLPYRGVRQIDGKWLIVKGRYGDGRTFKPSEKLHGGIYLTVENP